MLPVLLSNRTRRPSGTVTPTWFLGALASISPGNLRALWLPTAADTTTNTSRSDLRLWTYDANIAARISVQGNGVLVSFSGTGQYGSTPDADDLSFNTGGLTDLPFSIVALANITDSAADRTFLSKWESTGNLLEYTWRIAGTTNLMDFGMDDASVPQFIRRRSNAAINVGALHLFGVSYDGGGGATAMNGVTLYEDAAAIASTATNSANYVAMENKSHYLDLGAEDTRAGLMNGSMGFVALYAVALSAARHLQVKAAANKFYGTSL